MANPGGFRIEIDAATSGGVSDPRNGTMLKMFNLIDMANVPEAAFPTSSASGGSGAGGAC